MLSYVPATRKEGIAMAFADAQFLFGNVRLTPMLDKTPELRRKPVQESLQTANPTSRQQEAQTNDPGPGCKWLGYFCQTEMGNESNDKKN